MNLIKINETNKIEYKQFEKDTDLYDYQTRIYPDKTCDIVLWYYINEDDKDIGSVWLEIKHRTDKEAKLGIFIVDPMYRGLGIGRKAIDDIIRLNALKYGLALIRLNVRENNIRAQRAYLSCGFVEKDRYVKENGVAVVAMERDLKDVLNDKKYRI